MQTHEVSFPLPLDALIVDLTFARALHCGLLLYYGTRSAYSCISFPQLFNKQVLLCPVMVIIQDSRERYCFNALTHKTAAFQAAPLSHDVN